MPQQPIKSQIFRVKEKYGGGFLHEEELMSQLEEAVKDGIFIRFKRKGKVYFQEPKSYRCKTGDEILPFISKSI